MRARILVIEDNPANIELMVYLLDASGYTTLTAGDGVQGLEVAARERPDLIVCDIQMPRMNGYDVARALKGDAGLRRIPLIAVTAFAMVGDQQKAIDAGFDGYVTKPIDPMTFATQLEAFLDPELRGSRPAPPAPTVDGGARPAPTGARILVVDNDLTNLELAASVLGYAGHSVITTSDADEALALALRQPPALIISDVCMPASRSGFEFIRKIKSHPALEHVPFVFITSTAMDEKSRREGLALGATDFLFRPVDTQVLLDVVDKCLRGNENGSG